MTRRLDAKAIGQLKRMIRKEIKGWGGQGRMSDDNLMTYVSWAVDQWAAKYGAQP
jgi:hypothetical protein